MGNNKQGPGVRQLAGQKSTAQRLNQAINANFIKVETHQVGMKTHMARDTNGLMVEEPEKAIREFDDKMAEITAMLNRYKGEVDHPDEEAGRPHHPRASTAPPGSRPKKVAHQGPTEADAYMSQKIQKKVISVAPGAPRALSIKVHTYRSDPYRRAELEGRCQRHQQAIEEAEAKRKATLQGTQNFIQANQYWLKHDPEPTLIQVSALPLYGAEQQEVCPALASSMSVSTARSPFVQGGHGVSFSLTRPHSASTGQALRPTSSSLQATSVFVPSNRIQLALGAVSTKSLRSSPSMGGANAPQPRSTSPPRGPGAAGAGVHPRPSRATTPVVLMPPASFMATRPSSAAPTFHSTQAPHHQAARGARGGSPYSSGDEAGYDSAGSRSRSRGRSVSPEARVLMREARLAITARPASGGSPTTRRDFLAARQQYVAHRAEKAEEVRIRHEELQEQRQHRAQTLIDARIQREQQEAAHREAVVAYQDLVDRHAAWSAMSCLCYKLAFLKQEILEARKLMPLRALRKEAAVKIAGWYKQVLEGRHMRAMMDLAKRVSTLLKDHIPIKRQEVRQKCAERLLHFLKLCSAGGAQTAVVAHQRFRERLKLIQTAWRTAAMVRKTQRAILYVYFTRFERWIVNRNTKEARHSAHPSRLSGRQPNRHISHISGDGDGDGHNAHAGAISVKSRKAAEVEDPILEALLSTHKTMLPKEIRVQMVEKAIKDLRRKFQLQMGAYRAAVQLYKLQLPMEELRCRLLEDAGLEARPNLKKPVHPVMLVLLPKPALKRLLQDCLNLVEERKIAAQQERRLLAEKLWLEAQAMKQQGGTKGKAAGAQAGQGGDSEGAAGAELAAVPALGDSELVVEQVQEDSRTPDDEGPRTALEASTPAVPTLPSTGADGSDLQGQELSFCVLHEAAQGLDGVNDSTSTGQGEPQQQEEPLLVGRFASVLESQFAVKATKGKVIRLIR